MSPLRQLMLLASLFVGSTVAQTESSSSPKLPGYPDCAVRCIVSAFAGGLCSPTNQTCICTNEQFQQNVTACVTVSCTIPESLATKNSSSTNCGTPVRDRSREYVLVSHAMGGIAGAVVLIRFGYKIFVASVGLGIDDWFVLATMISCIPSGFITRLGTTANGLGKDIWTLSPDQITKVLFFFYIMAWLYFLQTTLVKLSIIAFYMRIFPARGVQRVLWATFIFTSLWGVAFIFTSIFQCSPIPHFWKQWDGMHEGTCANVNAISWSNASISIALDLWILAIPLWQLRSLKLHWKKKVGVALMFCVGTLVTVVSILRIQSLVVFGISDNKTWEFYDVSVWSTIEITVGIICACLPTVRMVLVKLFPVLAGTTQRSKGNHYYQYGSGNRPKTVGTQQGGTVETVTTGRPNSERGAEGSGIVFQKSYTVQYSDSDEIGLVNMANSNVPG
ncbi:CFEM domain-containing protein, partial [Dactylonectria macrodidyma]